MKNTGNTEAERKTKNFVPAEVFFFMAMRKEKNKKGESRKTVAVLFGGPSFEHEISVLTGVFVLNVLKRQKYDLLPVYIDAAGDFYTSPDMFDVKSFTPEGKGSFTKILFVRNTVCRFGKRLKPVARVDCAFNCCHGGWGEGGGVSALMRIYDIPLASPDAALSGVFMDKLLSKPLIAGMGIPFVRYTALEEGAFLRDEAGEMARVEGALGFPVIVKPARLGSSIGVSVARDKGELAAAARLGFAFDERLLVEEYLPDKRDINCAAYAAGGEIHVSECEEPLSKEEIFSFREKYLAGGKTRKNVFPADLPEEVSAQIKRYTERLYKELHFSGMVRADYLVCGNKIYFSEMNTVPGSLSYYLFTEKFSAAGKLFSALIEEALASAARQKRAYPLPGVLSSLPAAGGKAPAP